MSTTVHCPECNAPLELPDNIPSGKRLQCPDCGAAFSPPAESDRAGGMKTTAACTISGCAGTPRNRSNTRASSMAIHDPVGQIMVLTSYTINGVVRFNGGRSTSA